LQLANHPILSVVVPVVNDEPVVVVFIDEPYILEGLHQLVGLFLGPTDRLGYVRIAKPADVAAGGVLARPIPQHHHDTDGLAMRDFQLPA
jgi:hypothetical protein